MAVSSLSRRVKKAPSVEGQISALQCEVLFELAARVLEYLKNWSVSQTSSAHAQV